MKQIKLFSASKTKKIEGSDAELYVNFYLVLNRNYIFTFLIDSPNLACSDRNPIRLWKHWLMEFEEEYVKYLRRSENAQRNKSLAYLSGINDGLNVVKQKYRPDLCKSCTTKGCIFQSGIKREKCDFYNS